MYVGKVLLSYEEKISVIGYIRVELWIFSIVYFDIKVMRIKS